MSLETWIEEFYVESEDNDSAIELIDKSIKKWSGFNLKDAKKHGVVIISKQLFSGKNSKQLFSGKNGFVFDSTTCVLCERYLEEYLEHNGYYESDESAPHTCERCPIYQLRGGYACDEEMEDEFIDPYLDSIKSKDGEPMIKCLEKAREFVLSGKFNEDSE